MKRSRSSTSSSPDGQDRPPGRFFRKAETKPLTGAHLAYVDAQGVPYATRFIAEHNDLYGEVCEYRDRWIYLGTAQAIVPPCAARAVADRIGQGCPGDLERKCSVHVMRRITELVRQRAVADPREPLRNLQDIGVKVLREIADDVELARTQREQ